MKSGLKKIRDAYLKSEFRWRYISNFDAWAAYFMNRPKLEGEALWVLEEMNRSGIAVTSVDRLFGNGASFAELKKRVDALEIEQAANIVEARKEAEELKEKKGFIFPLLGDKPGFDPSDICARFVLQPVIREIADAYAGLRTELKFYNVWHTFKIQGEPRRSQLWHQDPEDYYIFRMFVYMTDVDEGAGPLTYVRGSHPKGEKINPEHFLEPGHKAKRSTDEQMKKAASENRWVRATGPAGTIIFADTRGYHKGGLARTSDRIMYNAMYTSPACRTLGSY